MGKRSYSHEQIINKLREVEINTHSGMSIKEAIRKIGVTDVTYYKWRKQYGGMKVNQVKKLKELENENLRLKKLVADLSLDNAVLREISSPKF